MTTLVQEIEGFARRAGLDPFHTLFQLCDYREMNEIAAFGGFPIRYSHWRFGMEFDILLKGQTYGLQRIYEIVINHDPCYAYLLECNNPVIQKMVICHVFAHSDFFKQNRFFSHTRRNMIDRMAANAVKIRHFSDRYGAEVVEEFLDLSLSLENLIDYQAVIPPGNAREIEGKRTRDLMLFLIEQAQDLEEWQRTLLEIVREEAYYFAPQVQTKIINEGWASFWHSQLMNQSVLTDREVIDYASQHSMAVATTPGQLNPYKLGIELFRDIEKRGIDPFEVRTNCNDATFVDSFLTEEFCHAQKMFVYEFNRRSGGYEIVDRNWLLVKETLLNQLANAGQPFIYVEDDNFEGRGELLLVHDHHGFDLKLSDCHATLQNLHRIWKKPVHLMTVIANQPKMLSCSGNSKSEVAI